ncbi:MAG: hypothetical protein Kow0010_19140 [Dehalococcoidia bacterium]
MAARTRSRTGGRATRSRSRRFHWTRSPLFRAEVIGIGIVALTVAVLPWVIDLRALLSTVRDATLRTFGLGVLILAAVTIALGMAISRRSYRRGSTFFQRAAGITALALFAWGALGLNEAEWTIGNVAFAEYSLGGRVGRFLVGGFAGKVAWLSLLVVAMALLAPNFSRWLAVNTPRGIETAWERRWPHRVVQGCWIALVALGRLIRFAFRRPGQGEREFDPVIGEQIASSHARAASFEEVQTIIRPSIDPHAPMSPLGTGAAAKFAGAESISQPVAEGHEETAATGESSAAATANAGEEDDEGFEENQQLGLPLESKSGWHLPPLELLSEPRLTADRKHDNAARARLIVDTLASFGVDSSVVEINEGPTVTQFGVEPGWEIRYKEVPIKDETGKPVIGADGRPKTQRVETSRTRVRVNRITALQNDLALALAAPSLRIEAPVPGRAIVGIEVPNDTASVVSLRSVMETPEFERAVKRSPLAIALGKGVSGVPVVADLAKMPHLLIAGATGSGKSVCINSVITCLMMNATPDQVRFVLVDPKRVELTSYSKIPHLVFSEVIIDMDKVVGTLQAVVAEMDSRYRRFSEMSVRNIEAYNRHPRVLKKLPYWVVVIDELADLMMVAPYEVEKLLCRLAQLARATGIHLVVATQRPSVDVVTGLIKANFPTRIAFAVTSVTDSRTILDMGGAEKLLGRGDMLYMPTDAGKPTRLQGVYVSDAEVERLVQYWSDERFKAIAPDKADDLLEQALIERNGGDAIEVDEDDPLLDEARALVLRHRRVSPSLLQRRLRVGYLKAERLIELLAEEGIVGPREDGESRAVLVEAAGTDAG